MKNFTNQKGITLIALVVTIIVLIILAGVSINLLFGNNGILQKAKDAEEVQKVAETKEQIQLALAEKQIETKGALSYSDIEAVLSTFGTVNKEGNTVVSVTPTGKTYSIALSDVYKDVVTTPVTTAEWEFATNGDKDSSNSLTIGDLVKPTKAAVASEQFYVIGIGTQEDPVVTLLAEKNVITNAATEADNYKQSPSANNIAFRADSTASNANVYSASDIKGEVDKYAAKLTKAGLTLENVKISEDPNDTETAKGRLMWGTATGEWDTNYTKWTYVSGTGELGSILDSSLTNKIDIVYGPTGAKIYYWFGFPYAFDGYIAVYQDGSNVFHFASGVDQERFRS